MRFVWCLCCPREVKKSFIWHADNSPFKHTVAIVGDLTGWTPKPASPSTSVTGQHAYEAVLRPGNHPTNG